MPPSRSFFQSRLASDRHGSLRVSAEPSPLSASFTSTDNPSPEQDFARNPTKVPGEPSDDLVLAPEQADEEFEFEEITYDELRLSLCPADPAHFAPVFGECPSIVLIEVTVVTLRTQTTSGHTIPLCSPVLAHPSLD